jgi:hypothetical protein
MPTSIPAGTKFMGVDPLVSTAEKRSSLSNSYQEFYTIEDIIASTGADDFYTADGALTGNRTVNLGTYDLRFTNGGNVGIGTATPGAKLDVNGKTKTSTFQLTTSPTAGYVLTSDASGNGTWQAPVADINIYNNDGTLSANRTVSLAGNTLTFSGGPIRFDNGSSNSGFIRIYEDSDFGGDYVQLQAPQAMSQTTNFVFPGFMGSSGQFLTNSGSGVTNWVALPVEIQLAASDETTALTTGTAKVTFRMPHAMTLTAVRASLSTAQASGSIFTVDINEGGTSILSTKLTIDNTEKTSTTAATAAVISDSSLADDAEITIDIDQIGDGTAKGLKVTLIGTR